MTTIPEEGPEAGSMDEFVNWGSPAEAATGHNADPVFPGDAFNIDNLMVSSQDQEVSLLFENPIADDFSFCAIEHYEQSNMPSADLGAYSGMTDLGASMGDSIDELLQSGPDSLPVASVDHGLGPAVLLGVPSQPCTHCQLGGYQCKKLQEGNYKGYCTSCVALRCECSFGLASGGPVPTDVSFPPNPWPTLGDHPDPIRYDEETTKDLNAAAATSATESDGSGSGSCGAAFASAPASQGQSSLQPLESAQPKLGARLSRESVRILKNWVSTHSRHPYPTEEEKESLQRLTGLTKTQISNWLANARRRGKIPMTRSTSPHVRSSYADPSGPVDIPQPRRSGTPSPVERHGQGTVNILLQRWANSPPENEPANVKDIARAITSTSGICSSLDSRSTHNLTDDGSNRSLFNESSTGTSQSSGAGSFASAFSHASKGSFNSSFSSLNRNRRRRRRRSAHAHGLESAGSLGRGRSMTERMKLQTRADARTSSSTPLVAPLKTYQCTFCTETFKTKHDWQRHEKSLHLSLERWVCTPQGPVAAHPETKQECCVFCEQVDPDAAHIESHDYGSCQERALGDRTFYRKDHLRQHLKLVHGVRFVPWSMEQWKVATPEIRSRCGFCGITMDTWSIRIDHLADHFKTGRTMADWKGDWGFEKPVLDMVENSIPPYLIHDERNSPLPFSAMSQSPGSPRNAYELLRGELSYWYTHRLELKQTVTDEDMRLEACRIVMAADLVHNSTEHGLSWLRDLLFSDEACTQRARLSPVRSQAENLMATLRVNGKIDIFDACPLEAELQGFVNNRLSLGLTPLDTELQAAARDAIQKAEAELAEGFWEIGSVQASTEKIVADFWLRLIQKSNGWLAMFRQRAHLPRSEVMADESRRPLGDPNNIDSTIHNDSRLQTELADYVRLCRAAGEPAPSDAALQRQARIIIYGLDDGWNQTAADDAPWLEDFKRQYMGREPEAANNNQCNGSSSHRRPNFIIPSPFFLDDTNCYRRLARELTRYANMAMSPNNPNSHVPTDEELQHQARWILYDDDDPWNQTAADNAEWLLRFKRDAGILPVEDGPGLPTGNPSWNIAQGGSGFAPPYCFPKTPLAPLSSSSHAMATRNVGQGRDASQSCQMSYATAPSAANKYLQTFTTRYAMPATVFCSRELEHGLVDYVRTECAELGRPFPSDEALRAKARGILGCMETQATPADDKALLEKFKAMMNARLDEESLQKQQQQQQQQDQGQGHSAHLQGVSGSLGMDAPGDAMLDLDYRNMNVDLNLCHVTQDEIDSIFQDMNFAFEYNGDLVSS